MKRAWPKNNFSPRSWVRNFFLVKLETLCYQLVKKSDPPNGVLGQALFWRKCLVLLSGKDKSETWLMYGTRRSNTAGSEPDPTVLLYAFCKECCQEYLLYSILIRQLLKLLVEKFFRTTVVDWKVGVLSSDLKKDGVGFE